MFKKGQLVRITRSPAHLWAIERVYDGGYCDLRILGGDRLTSFVPDDYLIHIGNNYKEKPHD